jgi:hypothetical protein
VETIDDWATTLAEAIAPDEADLAASQAAAFVRGGATRRELLRGTEGAVAGGFGAVDLAQVMPFALDAVHRAGPPLLALLSSPELEQLIKATATAVAAAAVIKDGAKLVGKWTEQPAVREVAEPEAARLKTAATTITVTLEGGGLDAAQATGLAGEIITHALAHPEGTRAFVAAATKAP